MKSLFSILPIVVFFISSCSDGASGPAQTESSLEEEKEGSQRADVITSSVWLADPCSLVDNQEMSDLLPNPVAGSTVSQGLCDYGPTDLNLGRVDVEVFIQDVTATGCDLFFSVGGFNSAEPVHGVGTAARWKGGSSTNQLGVCVDDEKILSVTLYDPDQATDPRASARAISELIISRLIAR